jgi:hypothetical protein
MQKYLMFFLDFYRKHFGTNEQFLITRDLTVIFAVIITIIIIITNTSILFIKTIKNRIYNSTRPKYKFS